MPRMVDGDDTVQVKSECKDVDPPVKTAELYFLFASYYDQLHSVLTEMAVDGRRT